MPGRDDPERRHAGLVAVDNPSEQGDGFAILPACQGGQDQLLFKIIFGGIVGLSPRDRSRGIAPSRDVEPGIEEGREK